MLGSKRSESPEMYYLAIYDRLLHARYESVNDSFSLYFGQSGCSGNFVNDVCFGQFTTERNVEIGPKEVLAAIY